MEKTGLNNYYKKYNKYKYKYISLKDKLVGGKKPGGETISIDPININILEKLLYNQDIHDISLDINLNIIKNDISYLQSADHDEIRKMIEINQSNEHNNNEIIKNISHYGLKYIKNIGTDFNNVKCKTFPDLDKNDLLANYNYKHRINRVIDAFVKDSKYPKYYSFIISDEGIIYGKVNDGIEFGATHIQLVRNSCERGIISGEIKVEQNKITFNFISSLFGFYNYMDDKRQINKGEPTLYYFNERVKMYKLILLTKKLIELSNKEEYSECSEYYYTEAIVFPDDDYPTEEEFKEICKDPSLIIVDTGKKVCGPKKNIKALEDGQDKKDYLELERRIIENNISSSLCDKYRGK
jgi:hypothetical protein